MQKICKTEVVLFLLRLGLLFYLNYVQKESKWAAHDWLVFFLSPLCSNFSSSHFGCSSRAEELCWCPWGQLHWQRGRGKHYLHYSRLEGIYVQYLAFGTHAQVRSTFSCSLFGCALTSRLEFMQIKGNIGGSSELGYSKLKLINFTLSYNSSFTFSHTIFIFQFSIFGISVFVFKCSP